MFIDRMKYVGVVMVLLALFVSSVSFGGGLAVPDRGFISSDPGRTWEEGLISGNGTIGANIRSEPLDETIVFTHERMFLPQGPPHIPPYQADRLFEIRRLISEGLYRQATVLASQLSDQNELFMYPDNFVPCFDMNIKMDSKGDVKDYMRSVNFENGEATVHWADDRGVFERRLFVSRSDGVAVLLITGPKGSVSCEMNLGARKPKALLTEGAYRGITETVVDRSDEKFKEFVTDVKAEADDSGLTFFSRFTKAYPGSIQSLNGTARVIAKNGSKSADGDTLKVTDADSVMVLVDIRPIYKGFNPKNSKQDPSPLFFEETKQKLAELGSDYKRLLGTHAAIHGEIFNRMRLDVGGGSDHRLTSEMLMEKTSSENVNRALVEKTFDAGRYNILSCTGELPPNLQGVWAGTYVPGWASDYTHNGNVPSAIASMMRGNMPELMLAYTSYIESIVPWMEINARNMFGCRGIVLPSRSTTNGLNNAMNPNFAGGFWVGGAAWAAHFFYDYYEYTGDEKFLEEHALPFMEKVAVFFEDYLYEGPDGKYIFSPTQSPENTPKNSNSQGTFNSTMDVAAAKELLNNIIIASNKLGKNKDKIGVWEGMLAKMPEYMINEDGIIKEWLTPRLKNNDNHRHCSQLYPLFDYMGEEIASSPELQSAFKKSVDHKLKEHWGRNARGFMSFGLVQLGQTATSLGESDMAYQCLTHLVNRFWLNNLASMHNHKTLFNMDISGGMPDVIIKMLANSKQGEIELLPAVPKAWPVGTVEGILCRGQVEIKSMTWSPNKIQVTLLSSKKQTIKLQVPGEISSTVVTKGNPTVTKSFVKEGLFSKRLIKNSLDVTLPEQQEISLEIKLK
ncbi:MAG: glycoside hydrolase N-terminal domain-containing protein [Phycisphaerae bacterium]|nr:glycoside hydrolase N-terminal domain-containing protein [Phycisphaerae bacterium]